MAQKPKQFVPAVLGDFVGHDVDETGDVNNKYYGFLTIDGRWYIVQINNTTNAMRYCFGTGGSTGYATGWGTRTGNSYGYIDAVFIGG